jgi:dTDP-glucose 4,6-dehydratase
LIPQIINRALCKKAIPIYGDGQNVRDWIHVSDHVKAIEGINGEVYNIGCHNEHNNLTIARLILDWLNKNVDSTITRDLITFVEDRKGHDRRYAIDNTKIVDGIGWQPIISFNDGLINTIKWYVDNYSIS